MSLFGHTKYVHTCTLQAQVSEAGTHEMKALIIQGSQGWKECAWQQQEYERRGIDTPSLVMQCFLSVSLYVGAACARVTTKTVGQALLC